MEWYRFSVLKEKELWVEVPSEGFSVERQLGKDLVRFIGSWRRKTYRRQGIGKKVQSKFGRHGRDQARGKES